MLDAKKIHEMEQSIAQAGEILPKVWRELFVKCQAEGFTEAQAMDLLKTWIISMRPTG